MVTIQDIGLQLTKPVKELAEWHFPFSQTLEKYCCLFNQTNNKSFGEAGLVLQNSTAVYVQRVDSLWGKMEHFRNVFSDYQNEEIKKDPSNKGKKDRKTNINFQNFDVINFAKDVEKNIDIKKSHVRQETLKSKNRRFTQLEKGITQHIAIDIYDINGEIIGKKYDFRCNQSINMDGILVDEFAPQDFHCSSDNSIQEKPRVPSISSDHSLITELLDHSSSTLALDSTIGPYDEDNDNIISDVQSERNCIDSLEKTSDLTISFESNQDLSLSRNNTDETLVDGLLENSDNYHDSSLTGNTNETCINTFNSTNSSISNVVTNNSTLSNNNNMDVTCLNHNIRNNCETNDLLDSPCELMKSQKKRTPSINSTQNNPLKGSLEIKSRQSKSTVKSNKRKATITPQRKGRVAKNLLNEFQSSRRKDECMLEKSKSLFKQKDKTNMLAKNLNTCIKYIKQYDVLQYEEVTNVALDFLGFRLRASEQHMNVNSNTSTENNIDTTDMLTSIEDESSETCSSTCADTLPLSESFCNTWFQSDSPEFLSENVDKWHVLIQPKLREAEKRSTFRIRDYASRIIESLQASCQRKINFDAIIQKERACEVARYFLASLDLASRQNVDINMDKNLEHNIEITWHEENRQYRSNGQMD